MPLSATALVSLLEAREFLGGELDGEIDRVVGLINAATDYCERKVEDGIVSREYAAEVFDGSGLRDLSLPHQPITSVASVDFLSTSAPVAWNAVDLTAYPLLILTPARRRIAFRNLSFPVGFQNVRVTYTAGYGDAGDVAPMPELLRQAALQCVKTLYDAKDDDGEAAVTSVAGGVGSQVLTYLDRALPKLTLDALASYRRRRF